MKMTLLLFFAFTGLLVYGQEPAARAIKLTPIKSETSVKPIQAEPADSLAGMTVEHCETVIAAIDSKVAYIKSDQTQNEKAIASGWYTLMERNRAAWVADRDELLRRKAQQK